MSVGLRSSTPKATAALQLIGSPVPVAQTRPGSLSGMREALRRFRLPELGNKFEAAGYDKLSDLVTLARTKADAEATLQGDIGIKEAHAVKLVRWLRAPPAGRAIDDLMGE